MGIWEEEFEDERVVCVWVWRVEGGVGGRVVRVVVRGRGVLEVML